MLNLQLKLGAFGQNAQGFEKDYRGEPEPPARGLGSVLPEIKNYGAGGEFVRERLEGTNKEGFGVSRYEFIRNQQRIEYPSVLFPQAPLALAKEQIKQIAQMLTKDYIKIRNSYLPDSSKQDMITQALLKVKGFPAPLVRVADRLAEDRMLEYQPFETVPENDIFYGEDEVEEVLSGLETPELTEIVLAGGGMGMDITPQMREEMYNALRRAFFSRESFLPRDVQPERASRGQLLEYYPTVPVINTMSGEGGDLEDIVAGDDSAPLKVAMPAPQAMDALGFHRGQPIREERRTYRELLRILPDTIAKESFDALTPTEQSNLRKAYRLSQKPMPTGIEAKRASKFAKAQRITGGALPREPEPVAEATASATSSVPAPMTREELRRATQQD